MKLRPVERISRRSFLERGTESIIADDVPVLIDWADPLSESRVVAEIVEGLDDTPVALFRKSADPATRSRSEVVRIRLKEFLETGSYRTSHDGFVHRVVTNIKNNPALIDRMLGVSALPVFDYSGASKSVNLWINYIGQFGRAHFDELENFNLQLTGAKRFILSPPGRKNYYVRPMLKGFGHHSDFANLLEVDMHKYPRFFHEKEKLQEAVIRPGQILYIPMGWWHQVYSLESLNINMNFWLTHRKILQRPYVFLDAVYKAAFRKLLRRYDYQPEAPRKQAVAT